MKYYAAAKLQDVIPVALPREAKPITYIPHVSLSVFESELSHNSFDLPQVQFEIGLTTIIRHSRTTGQILVVCPVITNRAFWEIANMVPADERGEPFYHVTVGTMSAHSLLKELFPCGKVINQTPLYVRVPVTQLLIEGYRPVTY